MGVLRATLDALAAAGHPPGVVTGAGTGTHALALAAPGVVTEVQPGSYALMDATYAAATDGTFGQAVHVVTSVRSVRGPGEAIVDAGFKALSTDLGPARVAGLDATWAPAGDEHGRLTGALGDLRAGDRVRLIPSHTDTTVRLYRELWVAGDRGEPAAAVPLF
jgi:3-hydroxy-D-aspartate aldolase